MAQKAPDSPELDPAIAAKMFPEKATEEVVAEIVAANPEKHGMTLDERLRRAKQAARRAGSAADEEEAFYRACVVEMAGGDPDEMLPGNKPRYTVDEEGNVKDHDTGKIWLFAPQQGEAPLSEPTGGQGDEGGQATGEAADAKSK